MSNGVLTAQIAQSLREKYEQQGYEMLHDHSLQETGSQDKSGKLHTWIGDTPKRQTLLSDLDIAIVNPNDKKIVALIEIEETTDRPKVILGDILAFLLGNGIAFRGKHDFQLGEWTTLVVISHNDRKSHDMRITFLSEQTNLLKSNLDTFNAKIGRIVIDSFADEKQLEGKLDHHIYEAITHYEIM